MGRKYTSKAQIGAKSEVRLQEVTGARHLGGRHLIILVTLMPPQKGETSPKTNPEFAGFVLECDNHGRPTHLGELET